MDSRKLNFVNFDITHRNLKPANVKGNECRRIYLVSTQRSRFLLGRPPPYFRLQDLRLLCAEQHIPGESVKQHPEIPNSAHNP